jgi:hypothetical protein
MGTKNDYTVGRIEFGSSVTGDAAFLRAPAEAAALDGIRELFALLDVVEVTDFGREFHPTTISSCRIHDFPKLCTALAKMRGIL